MKKTCFKCGDEKDIGLFYKHKGMADGHVNKCKECNKKDVRENRKARIDYYREYDVKRGNRQGYEYVKNDRINNRNKYIAHTIVYTHIKNGSLAKMPCELCGTTKNIHAHHDDYLLPLDITWLCAAHHSQWHKENGEGLNK